jgi:hypothetical protein
VPDEGLFHTFSDADRIRFERSPQSIAVSNVRSSPSSASASAAMKTALLPWCRAFAWAWGDRGRGRIHADDREAT